MTECSAQDLSIRKRSWDETAIDEKNEIESEQSAADESEADDGGEDV